MKRVFCLTAALLALSCAREIIPEPAAQEPGTQQENQGTGTYTVTLTASFEPETRLEVSPTEGTMTWNTTDKIAVFSQQGRLCEGSVQNVDGAHATFAVTLENDDAIEAGAVAYYPYAIAVEGHSDQILLPASFTDLGVASRTIPMKAVVSEGGALPFKHLASLLYVNAPTSTPSYPGDGGVPSNTPALVVFSAGDVNQPIAGKFTVGTDGTLTPAGDNGTSVQVPWVSGQPYLFALPPATYAKGFSLSITSAPYSVSETESTVFTFYRKKRSASYQAERANLLNMPAFDPQCKVFYLTSTATEWSDSEPLARMIQVSENSFLGALYSCKGSKDEWDLGLRILQGYNLGTHWHNTIGGVGTEIASYGKNVGNFNGSPAGVYKVSITLYDNNWRYTSEKVSNTDYNHQNPNNPEEGLSLVGFNDNWESGIPLTQKVGHNWYTEVTVDDASLIRPNTTYNWKIKRYDGWAVNWGKGDQESHGVISGTQLSTFLQVKDGDHIDPPNCSLNLPAGTYDIFFNDATGWIQFVKK